MSEPRSSPITSPSWNLRNGHSASTCNSGDLRRNRGPRHRRAGALARHAFGREVQGLWRVGVRDLWRKLFYRGKEVVVVGGGNTAVEEALFLTNFASHVTIVHRRDHFRAERILQDRLFKNWKIKVVWDSAIDEICGTENPAKVAISRLKNVKSGTLSEVAADGVFIAIGHAPATDLVAGQVKLKSSGYGRGGAELDGDLGAWRVRRRRRRR